MCNIPTAHEAAQLNSPHSDYYSNVYVNPLGSGSLAQEGQRLFPAGSILVKEKLLEADDEAAAGIGIMIKQDAGYNPEGGNWEYAYWDGQGDIQRGAEQVAHCQACHIGVSLGAEMEGAEYYQMLQQLDKSGPTRAARDSVFTTLWLEQIP